MVVDRGAQAPLKNGDKR